MPTDLLEICQQCKSKYEQSVNNLLKINKELEVEIEDWRKSQDASFATVEEADKRIKELEVNNQLLQEEINQIVTAEPDIRNRIIALIAPAIEWKEQFYTNGEYKELIELYRTYNPKKDAQSD